MRESALNFGPASGLVGVLTRPDAGNGKPRPAVVLLNAGVLHRVGPSRIHVRLARHLAQSGTTSFRIDLPGIGDSRGLGGDLLLDEALSGIGAAFDVLQRHAIADRFVVFGLCSGAGHAFEIACSDPRVVGVVMVDPPRVFPTKKATMLRLFGWLARPKVWHGMMRGRYGILGRLRNAASGGGEVLPQVGPDLEAPMSKDQVRAQLAGLVARGVRICFVATGSRKDYLYRAQLQDAFPGVGLDRVTYAEMFPEASHTFVREVDREKLEQTVTRWLSVAEFQQAPATQRPS